MCALGSPGMEAAKANRDERGGEHVGSEYEDYEPVHLVVVDGVGNGLHIHDEY
jgi:hypothetical protein